jgi:hypothetical protein
MEVYLLVSGVLLLPVLLWPAMLLTGLALNPGANIAGHWRVASAAVLLIAVAVDSMLVVNADRPRSLIPLVAWLIGMGLWGAWACNEATGYLILGSLFFIHSLRSATRLWQGTSDWWLWPAWSRDILACLALFLWPRILA